MLKSNPYIVHISKCLFYKQTRAFTYKARIEKLHHDGIDLKHQTDEIDPKEHIRRCSFYKDADIWSIHKTISPRVKTLGDTLEEGCSVSNDGRCVASMQSINGVQSLKWLTYSKVMGNCQKIGSHLWAQLGLIPGQSKVAILSSNCPEFLFVEQACYMYGFIVVSLYTTYDASTIKSILHRTDAEVLFVDDFQRIQSLQHEITTNFPRLKRVYIMNDHQSDTKHKIQSMSSIYMTMKTNEICPRPTIHPDQVATFILTSGTTGEAKIAMLSHENILATAKGHLIRLDRANIKKPITDRHCSFLPMAHIYERFILLQGLLRGTEFVFCPIPEKLVEYLSIVKPTQLSVVPRVLNKVYDKVMADVNQSFFKRILVQQALREQPPFLASFVFRKLRKLFGGEVKGMITGAAPIPPDVMHFFRIALNIPIAEGYGQTESSGAGTSTHAIDLSCGTIGTPVPVVEVKLIDVPGTTYLSEQNQGEICLRGPTVFKGYYQDETKTREILDDDGWLHTGDVGEWTENGTLKVIDRTKHIFKLNQGKYIAPERLEDIYMRSPWIAQIFIDGNSHQASVVAIVVPDEEYSRKHFRLTTKETTFAEFCQDQRFKEIILSDLMHLGEQSKLRPYEIPNNIHLHSELFSQDNGLLTVTLKTRRTKTRQHFQSIIDALYK